MPNYGHPISLASVPFRDFRRRAIPAGRADQNESAG